MRVFSATLLDELAAQARQSPRRRAHHNIHAGPDDPVQRFLVAVQPDSYFRPHRHAARSELAVVLRGCFDVLVFDASGHVTARHRVGAGGSGFAYETPRGAWHTLVPGADGGCFLEVKEGPYDPATATEFAAWAPAEGTPGAGAFSAWLRGAQPGERPARS